MLTVFAIWAAGVAMTLVWLARAATRPPTEVDRRLSAVDADLDRLEAARRRHPSKAR